MNEQDELLCKNAVTDILSIKLLSPDRIDFLYRNYIDLYNDVNYTPKGEIGKFYHLYLRLLDIFGLLFKMDHVKVALEEFNKIDTLDDENIIKWLVKFEEDGLNVSTNNYISTLDNIDELPDGLVSLHPDFDVKVEVAPFMTILNFVEVFDEHYYRVINKYRTEIDDETYYENLREYYKHNHRQKKLIDFAGHIINPPIKDIFENPYIPLDINKLKRYVPIRIEYYSLSSTSDNTLQQAHDLFHQDEYEDARNAYKDFLQYRNDSQEAWLGLTICNFILGDYQNAYITCSNLHLWRYRDLVNYIEKYVKDSTVSDESYYINDKTCEDSINEFEITTDAKTWLSINKPLFNTISIKPIGFPSVANSNYNGKHYSNISKFHSLFERIQFEEHILETKSHLEAVVYFIEMMNANKLANLLNEQRYCRNSKSKFIELINQVFYRFKEIGDTRLYAEQGTCVGCNIGCNGYTFMSDKTRGYIDFVFEVEENVVIDIQDCGQFKNDTIIRSMLGERMSFYPNDMPF